MEGFGIEYHVAYQILGINPNTSIFAISQGDTDPRYDIRFWIWESTQYQWTIKDVGEGSVYFKWDVCKDPKVEGLFFVLHDSRMFFLYPQGRVDQYLQMEFITVSEDMTEELILHACNDEGWRRIE